MLTFVDKATPHASLKRDKVQKKFMRINSVDKSCNLGWRMAIGANNSKSDAERPHLPLSKTDPPPKAVTLKRHVVLDGLSTGGAALELRRGSVLRPHG